EVSCKVRLTAPLLAAMFLTSPKEMMSLEYPGYFTALRASAMVSGVSNIAVPDFWRLRHKSVGNKYFNFSCKFSRGVAYHHMDRRHEVVSRKCENLKNAPVYDRDEPFLANPFPL